MHVLLPQTLDQAGALGLTLPGLVDLVLEVPADFEAQCRGLLVLSWRCCARQQVDASALPAQARACFGDWLMRARAMDVACSLPASA